MCHFHHIPEDVQVTWGLGTRCRQRMPMTLPNVRTAVTQRPETDYKTFKRNLANALGHPVSSSWPSSSHRYLMKRSKAVSTTGQDTRDSLSQKKRREGVMKRNKCCNLTLKQLDGPFRTSAMFPREIIVSPSSGCSTKAARKLVLKLKRHNIKSIYQKFR